MADWTVDQRLSGQCSPFQRGFNGVNPGRWTERLFVGRCEWAVGDRAVDKDHWSKDGDKVKQQIEHVRLSTRCNNYGSNVR